MTEQLFARMAALELALYGKLINLPANSFLGRLSTAGTVQAMEQNQLVTSIQGKKGAVNLTSFDLSLSSCWQLTNRSNTQSTPFDANAWVISNAFAGVKWLDGAVSNLGLPPGINTGIIRQKEPLHG
ncbi:MAG: hypothetical protein ICV80_19395, partial [Microcoleus sp. T1-bin1]|nr:hypothetical protein [Microcoleus sp. T1-bin1]